MPVFQQMPERWAGAPSQRLEVPASGREPLLSNWAVSQATGGMTGGLGSVSKVCSQ